MFMTFDLDLFLAPWVYTNMARPVALQLLHYSCQVSGKILEAIEWLLVNGMNSINGNLIEAELQQFQPFNLLFFSFLKTTFKHQFICL